MEAARHSLIGPSDRARQRTTFARLFTPGWRNRPASRVAEAQPANKLGFLDALRGFAAAWVFFHHLWGTYYPRSGSQGEPFRANPYPEDPFFWVHFVLFQYGYVAVQLFFVVSGFCIHYRQAKAGPEATLHLGDYARRRFWRIYPAYLASIFFALVLITACHAFNHSLTAILSHYYYCFKYRVYGPFHDVLINATCTQLIWPRALNLNGVYWTLVFEMQFYLVYPLFLWLRRRVGLWPLLLGFGAVEAAYHVYYAPPPLHFTARFFEWLLGALAAEWFVRPPGLSASRAAYLVAGAAAVTGVASTFLAALFPFRDMCFAVAFFGIVHWIGQRQRSRPEHEPGYLHRALAWVGMSSYSLYLIHVPVILVVLSALWRAVDFQVLSAEIEPYLRLIIVPLAFGAAYVFYQLFERPFLPGKA